MRSRALVTTPIANSSGKAAAVWRHSFWGECRGLFGGNAGVRRGGPDIDQPDERRADAASRNHRGSLGVAGVVAAWKFDRVDSHRSAGGYSFGDRLPNVRRSDFPAVV